MRCSTFLFLTLFFHLIYLLCVCVLCTPKTLARMYSEITKIIILFSGGRRIHSIYTIHMVKTWYACKGNTINNDFDVVGRGRRPGAREVLFLYWNRKWMVLFLTLEAYCRCEERVMFAQIHGLMFFSRHDTTAEVKQKMGRTKNRKKTMWLLLGMYK